MRAVLLVLGVAVVAFALLDFLWTTTTAEGAGPMTRRLLRAATRLTHRLQRRSWVPSSATGKLGSAALLGSFAIWFVLTWLGWTLIFLGAGDAVMQSSPRIGADFWDRTYFVGYTILTLGIGDYVPRGAGWQIATIVAAANGFILITATVSYLISVLSAAVTQRTLAGFVADLGGSAEEVMERSYDGGFEPLMEELALARTMLVDLDQRYSAFPILHHFVGADPSTSMAVSAARLEEILNLLEYGAAAELRPHPFKIRPLRTAVERYANSLAEGGVRESERPLPSLDLDRLARAGIPVETRSRFEERLAAREDIRRRLHGFRQERGLD